MSWARVLRGTPDAPWASRSPSRPRSRRRAASGTDAAAWRTACGRRGDGRTVRRQNSAAKHLLLGGDLAEGQGRACAIRAATRERNTKALAERVRWPPRGGALSAVEREVSCVILRHFRTRAPTSHLPARHHAHFFPYPPFRRLGASLAAAQRIAIVAPRRTSSREHFLLRGWRCPRALLDPPFPAPPLAPSPVSSSVQHRLQVPPLLPRGHHRQDGREGLPRP